MDSISRGPLHQSFVQLIGGLVTFRAYDKLGHFRGEFMKSVEKGVNSTFCYVLCNRWMSLRLDFACVVFSGTVAALAVGFKGNIDNGLLSYTLQVITDLVALFSTSLRMLTEMENYMTSSQRIYEYTKLKDEGDLIKDKDKDL